MVSCRALIHALVAEKVHAEMTLNTLHTCLVALEASFIALRTNTIDFEVVARAVIPTSSIKVERQKAFRPRITL